MRNKLINFLIIILFIFSFSFYLPKTVYASNSSSEIVMELNSLRILHKSNERERKYMASTTKILTALCVIESCNLDDIVTIQRESVGIEGSSIYLKEGEKLTVKELLYGLMLRSGNDCAHALATYCSGNIKNFADYMNKKAQEIGAIESNFVNPHGLHDDNHYTTAYDLALISCEAMKNDIFRNIVCTKSVKIPSATKDYDRLLVNKNKMLKEFDGSTGIKTGYTKKAGRCLVSSCIRNGMELICVVLNCPPMFERSKSLLTDNFNNYNNYLLVESDNIIDFVDVVGQDKKIALVIKKDIIIPMTETEYNNVKIIYEYPEILKINDSFDKEIGFVKIFVKNNLIFEEKIYTIIK